MKNLSSKRAKACAIPHTVKKKVWERDNLCSIFPPHSPYAFPECHYISRANSGKGIEENIFTATREEHRLFDSGTKEERDYMRKYARAYFESIYPNWNEDDLVYDRWKGFAIR